MLKFKQILVGAVVTIGAFLLLAGTAEAVSILIPQQGGTGTGVIPTFGQVLVGQTNGTYLPQATSTLNISGGGSGCTGASSTVQFIANTTCTGNNNLTFDGTHLGIGTTTATTPLSIQQATNSVSAGIALTGTSGNGGNIGVSNAAGNLAFNSDSNSFTFNTNGVNLNIGTGAMSFGDNLRTLGSSGARFIGFFVAGTIRLGSGTTGSAIADSGGVLTINGGSTGAGIIKLNGTGTGFVGIGTTTPLSALAVGGTGGASIGADYNIAAPTNGLIVEGNVGIGTSTPGSILSVNGVGNFTTATSTFYSSGGLNLTSGCYAVNGVCITRGGSSFGYPFPLLGLGTTSPIMLLASTTIGDGSAIGGLTVSGNATTTGTAYFAGNVGVGTTTPYAKLSAYAGGDFAPHAASTVFAVGSSSAGTATSTLFNVTSNARVGIASVNPQSTLYINQTGGGITGGFLIGQGDSATNYAASLYRESSANSGHFSLYNGTVTPVIDFSGASGGTSYFNTGGNLGIGSTTPGSLLSVGNTGWNFYDNATSTDSGAGGINLKGGCYAINGVCIGSGSTYTASSPITLTGTAFGILAASASQNGYLSSVDYSLLHTATTTAGTGLTYSGNAFNVNTTQNISTLSNLTVAGFVQTTSGGVLSSAALTSGQVTTALGFTPYNATNPSSYIALTALSGTAPITYNNTTGVIAITQASGSTNGYLSSTDWTTFNGKQAAITGTTGQFPYFSASNTLTATSTIFLDTTGKVGIGTTTPGTTFSVQGVANFVASGLSTFYNDIKIAGNLFLPTLGTPAGSFLAVNATGQVIATSTPSGTKVTNYQVFTSSGTFNVPTGITTAYVQLCGGGGGGGGGPAGVGGSSGGGGGGYSEGTVTVTSGGTVTVTVGAAGTQGAQSGSGGTGGTTTFSTISATGGVGGTTNATQTGKYGGVGGIGSGGTINTQGGTGGFVLNVTSPAFSDPGSGGASFFSGETANGTNATYCGGAAGVTTGANTNNAAAGLVIVRW